MAIADLDKDGRLDVVISNNNATPTIYLNRLPLTGNWFRCNLVGAAGKAGANRDALGSRVIVRITAGGSERRIVRWVEAGCGYAAQSEGNLHFGLGDAKALEGLTIAWPSGVTQEIAATELQGLVNRECTIMEGRGIIPTPRPAGEGTTTAEVPAR